MISTLKQLLPVETKIFLLIRRFNGGIQHAVVLIHHQVETQRDYVHDGERMQVIDYDGLIIRFLTSTALVAKKVVFSLSRLWRKIVDEKDASPDMLKEYLLICAMTRWALHSNVESLIGYRVGISFQHYGLRNNNKRRTNLS
ncbi:hypothetical protein MKW98_010165 [Papaver atlanticum]|uniref:Uncharacterized protein n=1 Tax=Papaver atlanticum TaxID=357466 RepID=A0AAD4RY60_9MAGN|nr:hypothetical protein MKW98_010165 [Papaver atlanticum]